MDDDRKQLKSATTATSVASKSPIIKVTSAHSTESSRDLEVAEPAAVGRDIKLGLLSSTAADDPANVDENNSNNNSGGGNGDQQARAVSLNAKQGAEAVHAYKRRWLVLAIFCSHSAVNSFQWIQYSSITNIVSTFYGVSNLEVNLTSLIYMITYIPFIIHASILLERIGLRNAICLGAFGTALGSSVKLIFVDVASSVGFVGLMCGQTIVALSQLFIISIPPLLAAVWFPDHQVSTATGIGVFGNQLGIALGFILPPLLMSNPQAPRAQIGRELRALELSLLASSVVIVAIALVFINDKPPKPPGSASLHAAQQQQQHQHQVLGDDLSLQTTTTTSAGNSKSAVSAAAVATSTATSAQSGITTATGASRGFCAHFKVSSSVGQLYRDKDFTLLTLSYGINVGCFYAVSTILNQMVAKSWPNPEDLAGTMGLLIVVCGMLGSIMCGQLLDRTHAFKFIIVLIYLMSLVSMLLFTLVLRLVSGAAWPLYLVSMTLGFFMTGYLPLGFEFAAEITYPHPANTPAGLLNLSAQIFGLILTYGSSLIVDKDGGDLMANLFLTGFLTIGLVLTAVMKADLKRQKAVAEEQMKL